jgi:acetylornithine deacetylase
MDAVGLLRDLVRTPSESGHEGAVLERLFVAFRELGLRPVRSGRNLYSLSGEEGPLLLLVSHVDTVPAGEGWTRAPYDGEIEGGRLYGRGSNDAKGSVVAMAFGVARAVRRGGLRGRVCLAAVSEEETTGAGIRELLGTIPRPDAAVVGEPTRLEPAVAQKGLLVLELTAEGRSAHVAWGEGVNAIERAARDVLALSALSFEREHPLLGFPSVQVTGIQGGTRHNVVPARCRMVVDVRTTPAYTDAEILDRIAATVGSSIEVRSRRLPPVETDPRHPIVQAALAARPGSRIFGSPTLSDWVALVGVPTVKVGPGDSRRSHMADEYLEIGELEEGIAFYERLVRGYLGESEGR